VDGPRIVSSTCHVPNQSPRERPSPPLSPDLTELCLLSVEPRRREG
jgi:hypothetical protein